MLADLHFVRLPDLSDGFGTALTFPDPAGLSNGLVWTTAITIAIVASLETLLCVEATDKLNYNASPRRTGN